VHGAAAAAPGGVRSLSHIHAQLIDDGRPTVAAASSEEAVFKGPARRPEHGEKADRRKESREARLPIPRCSRRTAKKLKRAEGRGERKRPTRAKRADQLEIPKAAKKARLRPKLPVET
jgi:hypothetical protein